MLNTNDRVKYIIPNGYYPLRELTCSSAYDMFVNCIYIYIYIYIYTVIHILYDIHCISIYILNIIFNIIFHCNLVIIAYLRAPVMVFYMVNIGDV